MIEFDQANGRYIVTFRRMLNGKRHSERVSMVPGQTEEDARQMEKALERKWLSSVDPYANFRQSVLATIEGVEPKPGDVYVLRNAYFPGLLKIGMTTHRTSDRLQTLNTSVPCDFEIVASCRVTHALAIETAIHAHLSAHRIARGKEFFRVEEAEVIALLEVCEQIAKAKTLTVAM